ncbi:MAG: solute-binding protein [Chloroflexaceae bacterium]|nr:solute-binding protein [Chloroflexaceae bacterium]
MLRIAQSIAGLYLIVALVVTVITLAQGPLLGGAPLGGILDGAVGREPVTISIAYGSEKDAWLKAAAAEFAATNPRVQGRSIEVRLEPVGSREIVTRIVQDDLRPTVVSPASSVQIELLRSEWQVRTNTDIYLSGADAPQPLVLTPLVVVAWEERASMLGINNPDQLWDEIHRLVVSDQGWAQVAGQSGAWANLDRPTPPPRIAASRHWWC